MNLEIILLSEVTLTQKDSYCMLSVIHKLQCLCVCMCVGVKLMNLEMGLREGKTAAEGRGRTREHVTWK